MDVQSFGELRFSTLVWLCPLAFALHVLEEAPRFTSWVNRFISTKFRRSDYGRVHLAGLVIWVVATFLVSRYPAPWLVFLFFMLSLAPGFFFNTVFHAGGTLFYGAYSPGVVTALTIFLPLFATLSIVILREGLLSPWAMGVAFVVAGIFHTVEVANNTYGVNLLARRR